MTEQRPVEKTRRTRGRKAGPPPRPFLKWAGGKTQLLPELLPRVQQAAPFKTYHEPFVGGGALFFALWREGALNGRAARLSDSNPNLIEAYEGVRDTAPAVIALLEAHEAAHCKEHYYAVRASVPVERAARAARIIYLNRTCFNGLYRENSKGLFNVPLGDYKNPLISDRDNLLAAGEALRNAELRCECFTAAAERAQPGDFVYFDPPYHPLSETSSFTSYSKNGFGAAQQEALAETCRALSERDVRFLLSNSMTPFIAELYAGFTVETVDAARAINSKASGRGKIPEALIRNY